MALKVTHDGEAPGEVRERCCLCRAEIERIDRAARKQGANHD